MLGTYRRVFRIRGAAGFFVAASVGRAGIAMSGLGIVWLVHGGTGSYAAAGGVAGAFAVAEGVMGPQVARLIDRFGQTRVLPFVLLGHAAAVGALLTAVTVHGPYWSMVVGGLCMGASIPQLGALSATRWSALLGTRDVELLRTAFALESLANGAAYLVGPSLVSTIGALHHPALGSALAATLIVGGGAALSMQRRTAPAPDAAGFRERGQARRSLLRSPFITLVAVNLVIGGFFSAVQVSVTAFAVEQRQAVLAPILFTLSNLASLTSAWVYGLARWPGRLPVQLALATAWMALGAMPLTASGSPALVGAGMVLTGLAVPVILVLCSTLTRSVVAPGVLTQAFTWTNSASAAGSAAVAALTGRLVDGGGAHGGFLVAAGTAGALALVGVAGLRVFPRPGSA